MAEGAGMALQMAGQIFSGVAGYKAGSYNRDVARTEATELERAGAAEEARVREAARMAIGQQVAAQGSNGFQQGTGSAIDAIAQSQVNAAMDALTVRQNAAARARAKRIEGDIAYAAGYNGLIGSALGAAKTGVDWASSRRNG